MRLIHYSNDSGSKEGIFLTDDTEMDASEACPPGCTVINDCTINDRLPSTLPLEYNLEKI